MTNTSTHILTTKNQFKRIYNHTLLNFSRSEHKPNDATLHILGLLSDAPQHHLIHALELWLFCEARKIYNTVEKTSIRKRVIQRNIVEPFVMQLSPELRLNKIKDVEQIVYSTLANMGFSQVSASA